ncbi:MAG: SAM-dependent chlorinase/fluorinase [Deltaproteobacteria bacterium]|nr:SAM-dependent chlorinase/fluorinase [Deltaproteobacteria bacterium]
MSIITLTTDFGLKDNFVGVMKGVILEINLQATVVDLTHDLPRHNISHAGFSLWSAYSYFPAGTIHAAVVDPGVGSARSILAVKANRHFFIAPDNGLLSYIMEDDPNFEARLITNPALPLSSVSRTFRGRDVIAPSAAHLSMGFPFCEIGPLTLDLVRLPALSPKRTDDLITGRVIYVDHFGNLITNISENLLAAWSPSSIHITVGHVILNGLRPNYASVPVGEYLAVIGSNGLVEIARNMGIAEDRPHLTSGTAVVIRRV